jgi:hypothetical protein
MLSHLWCFLRASQCVAHGRSPSTVPRASFLHSLLTPLSFHCNWGQRWQYASNGREQMRKREKEGVSEVAPARKYWAVWSQAHPWASLPPCRGEPLDNLWGHSQLCSAAEQQFWMVPIHTCCFICGSRDSGLHCASHSCFLNLNRWFWKYTFSYFSIFQQKFLFGLRFPSPLNEIQHISKSSTCGLSRGFNVLWEGRGRSLSPMAALGTNIHTVQSDVKYFPPPFLFYFLREN